VNLNSRNILGIKQANYEYYIDFDVLDDRDLQFISEVLYDFQDCQDKLYRFYSSSDYYILHYSSICHTTTTTSWVRMLK
jgi:hypothetical protein